MSEDAFLGALLGAILASLAWIVVTRFTIYKLEKNCDVQRELNAALWALLTVKGIVSHDEAIAIVHRAIGKAFKENTG